MAFLAPFFLLGLSAIAIPIVIHLIQRERKRVVEFPSLMFIRRIPYQSVRRRRIRHWVLLLMRAVAVALLVLAFARPFFRQSAIAAAAAASGGAHEVVVLLDQSASMGYGDHWLKAQDAAKGIVRNLGGGDRATLVLFGKNAEEHMRATSDRGRLEAAISAARVTSSATRYGPALKLADSILSRSTLTQREVVLISDFQKSGWGGSEDVHFPNGITLTTISVASDKTTNVSVPSVNFARTSFSGQERVVVTAGITNRGDDPLTALPVTLSIEGRDLQTEKANVGGHTSTSVTFAPFTLTDANIRGNVRAGTDPLPADNTFYFVVAPSAPVSVLIVDNGDRPAASFYLAQALSVGNAPVFQVDVVSAARLTPTALDKRSVVILNDTAFPPAAAGGVLKRFIERGGGLLVVTGDRSGWPSDQNDLLPGTLGQNVDRTSGRSGTLGYRDYSHPVFEVFKAPRSGDFSSTHVFHYRALTVDTATSLILARYDDGSVAAAEKRVGNGRVIVWTSTLDNMSSDLAIRPVFLPLVHQLMRYLARYEQAASWFTVGQVLDLSAAMPGSRGDRLIVAPSGRRSTEHPGGPGLVELEEQGIYEIRAVGATTAKPLYAAVNLDPAEADLATLDPRELVAAVTGHASDVTAAKAPQAADMPPNDAERRQGLWWYLLFAGLLLLAAETVISNQLSRRERFL